MFPSDPVRVLEALNVLRNIPEEALQSYRNEILSVLQVLVGTNGCAVISQAQGDSSPPLTETNGTPSVPTDCRQNSREGSESFPAPPRSVFDVMKALDNKSTQIEEYLSRTEDKATGSEPNWINEDPRIVDLQIDGNHSSPETKFRKGLSQRSLAIEFDNWESKTYGRSRVRELVEDLSISHERRVGHIKEYIEANHQFKNQKSTRAGIEHGIKLLVFEQLLGKRVVSAVLIFTYRRFRMVKFEELACLKKAMERSEWVTGLTERKADWLDGCQNYYDAWYNNLSQAREPDGFQLSMAAPSRKRRRLNQTSNNEGTSGLDSSVGFDTNCAARQDLSGTSQTRVASVFDHQSAPTAGGTSDTFGLRPDRDHHGHSDPGFPRSATNTVQFSNQRTLNGNNDGNQLSTTTGQDEQAYAVLNGVAVAATEHASHNLLPPNNVRREYQWSHGPSESSETGWNTTQDQGDSTASMQLLTTAATMVSTSVMGGGYCQDSPIPFDTRRQFLAIDSSLSQSAPPSQQSSLVTERHVESLNDAAENMDSAYHSSEHNFWAPAQPLNSEQDLWAPAQPLNLGQDFWVAAQPLNSAQDFWFAAQPLTVLPPKIDQTAALDCGIPK